MHGRIFAKWVHRMEEEGVETGQYGVILISHGYTERGNNPVIMFNMTE